MEYHPTLVVGRGPFPTHLILDLDPPEGADFSAVVATARLVQRALADSGLTGAAKTSGAKGLHVFVPLADGTSPEDAAAATRALAARAARLDPDVATTAYLLEDREHKVFVDSTRSGGATVVAAYSPRVRPDVPVSFPVAWDSLEDVHPRDFTVRTAAGLLGDGDPWRDAMPRPQTLPDDVLAEGHESRSPGSSRCTRASGESARSAADPHGRDRSPAVSPEEVSRNFEKLRPRPTEPSVPVRRISIRRQDQCS